MAIILLAGALAATNLMPFKYVRGWRWENTWLAYASIGYLVFPILSAFLTIPNLGWVYGQAATKSILLVALFGFGWGTSLVLQGLALDMVGLSMTASITGGSSIAIGSLVPLVMLEPSRIFSKTGVEIAGADLMMIAGVIICAYAGKLRERLKSPGMQLETPNPRFGRGIILCFIAGLLAPLLNVALASGDGIIRLALEAGAKPHFAANSVWGLTVFMGGLPSVGFCLAKLKKNRTWNQYAGETAGRNLLLCFSMGFLFITATTAYGAGAGALGPLGPVLGWPVYMSAVILGNNFWGWYTGEWKGAHPSAVRTMFLGIGFQIFGMGMAGAAK